MTDDKKKTDMPRVDQWGVPYAKIRDWTDQEVAVAVAYLKREIPKEWAELERLELTTGDLNGSKAIDLELGKLSKLHPECDPYEVDQLSWKVREIRRYTLGLK
jgi:hypothetical protein